MSALDELDGDEPVVLAVAHQPGHPEVSRPDVPHLLVLVHPGEGRSRRRRHRRRCGEAGSRGGAGDGGAARRIDRRVQVAVWSVARASLSGLALCASRALAGYI